ncbi:UNVERIFIED_CONTAM: hypothetical protein Sindi_1703000 [Sesamum indicum]
MDSQFSLNSLSHTRTPSISHTKPQVQNVPAGSHGNDGDEAADDEGVDDDGFRQETVRRGQVSGQIHDKIANPPLMEVQIEEINGDSDTLLCWHGDKDGKGIISDGKAVDLGPGSSLSELGFCAAHEDETTPVEAEKSVEVDEATTTVMEAVAMADDSRTNGEDEDLVRHPNLGFDSANLNENHGEWLKSSFNMAEFLRLAHKVIDKTDHESVAALEKLRIKWEMRFGKVAMLRCFPPERMMPRTTDPARARRQAYRSLLPASTMGKTTENDGADGLTMAETSQPAKLVAGNLLRRSETVQTGFPTEPPARDVDSEVAIGSGDVDDDVEPNSAADLAQRLDVTSDDISLARAHVSNDRDDIRAYVSSDAAADVINDVGKNQLLDNIMAENVECNMAKEKSFVAPTLKFIAPTLQNGEVIVRPTLDTIRNGSKRWKTTAVGYFLGKRSYFHHLKEYALSVWPGLREFKSVADMEDIIEGGPWLFQGQPIVLQKWESGMVLRKLKHTQVPVWVKLRHLPVELWTEEGLSIVASGVGKPLYPDAITKACTRLDFARVCVMLDVNSKMPKHIIIMTPDEEGGEVPCKVDVEYEWLPPRCTSCMTLGHSAKECTVNKPKCIKPPVNVYVPKVGALRGPMVTERTRDHPTPHTVAKQTEDRGTRPTAVGPSREERGKEIVTYNSFDALQLLDSAEGSSRGPKRSNPVPGDPC